MKEICRANKINGGLGRFKIFLERSSAFAYQCVTNNYPFLHAYMYV